MKKIFEKFKKKAQELFCWLFCSEVLDAINAGCSYEEVETVAQTCVAGLTGEGLISMLSSAQQVRVQAGLPKFENEYGAQLGDILKEMGMTDAFDPVTADFSRMGESTDGNLFVSSVIHKTFISVAEEGTRAGAATMVVAADGAALIEEFETVILDRPFVYLLIDTETNIPFFMGTVMEP